MVLPITIRESFNLLKTMEIKKFTYLLLMLSSVLFPILLSFDKQVAFYKKWKSLFWATIIPASFFIIWDSWFTLRGVWSFNDEYTLGFKILGLPIEEWLFFVVIPYCSLFVYEVLKSYFPLLDIEKLAFRTFTLLLIVFTFIAFNSKEHEYTFWNFTFNAIFLIFLLINKWFKKHQSHLLLAFLINLLPMLLVNGVLTSLPVVKYNINEISGLMIYTIPTEDFFYFLLLFMMNVFIFERLERK